MIAVRGPPAHSQVRNIRPEPRSRSTATGAELSFDLGGEIAGPGAYSFALRSPAGAVTRVRSADGQGVDPELTVSTGDAVIPAPADGACVTGALLVPSCGVL